MKFYKGNCFPMSLVYTNNNVNNTCKCEKTKITKAECKNKDYTHRWSITEDLKHNYPVTIRVTDTLYLMYLLLCHMDM